MRYPLKILLILLLACLPASATYVQSGVTNFAGRSSITCSPNNGSGSVTSGNTVVIGIQANSTGIVSLPTSTHVPVWIQDALSCCNLYTFHGVATSSGVETITAGIGSFVLAGAVCGEYTTPVFNTAINIGNSISATSGDVIAIATSSVSSISTNPPFTQRQAASFAGTDFLALADDPVTSPGTYTSSFNNATNAQMISFFVPATARLRARIIRYRPPGNRSIIRTGGK